MIRRKFKENYKVEYGELYSESQEDGVRKDQKLSVMICGRNAFGL